MKSVNEIKKNHEGNNFGVNMIRDEAVPKRVKIISWWGLGDTYEQLCKDLRREGYTVLDKS